MLICIEILVLKEPNATLIEHILVMLSEFNLMLRMSMYIQLEVMIKR